MGFGMIIARYSAFYEYVSKAMVRFLGNSRGMALLLTILIISLVVSMTLELNSSMRDNAYGAANLRDSIRLDQVAKSGLSYALAVLRADALADAKDMGRGDSLLEAWADHEALADGSASLFTDSRLDLRILDHSGRIQINNLVNDKGEYSKMQIELLTRFLESPEFDLDTDQAKAIVAAIVDWIDKDDTEYTYDTLLGAEKAYYATLDSPYPCRDGPIEFLEELLLVKGMTKELYYGTGDKPGISGYLSTYGDGKININTADRLVLKALSADMTDWMVDNMIEYRQDSDNNLSQIDLNARLGGGVDSVALDDEALLTTKSSFFEVLAVGLQEVMAKRVTAMVERTEDGVNVLWKQIE